MNSKIILEDGLAVGSNGKYDLKNPLARKLLAGFDKAIFDLARQAAPSTVFEVGCGEGHTAAILLEATNAKILSTDISKTMVERSRAANASPRIEFRVMDVMKMEPPQPAPDLVVCCEVLEHLDDPVAGLKALVDIGASAYLLSVPREPIWRILNFARGAYVKDFGNSPGHLNHWSKNGFLRFISSRLKPVTVRSPLPWTAVLAVPHGK